MSALFKLAPPGGDFKVQGSEGHVYPWRKAVALGGEVDRWGRSVHTEDGRRPPLAPTRFAAQLKEKKFTNNADLKVVCDLVRAASAPPTPHAPLPPPLHRSTTKRCATALARAIGWRTGSAGGATRRRRSWV